MSTVLSDLLRRNRKNEIFKMITTLGVVTVLGISVAAAAISIGPAQIADPAMRPLSTVPGLMVAPAFGVDDEDCTTVTRRHFSADGHMSIQHELVCEQ